MSPLLSGDFCFLKKTPSLLEWIQQETKTSEAAFD
jgi:hypothetical protein